ncbi:MAG: carboxypeptidase regulatory-like domain-containing protein [Patescibacteria group bacterium]
MFWSLGLPISVKAAITASATKTTTENQEIALDGKVNLLKFTLSASAGETLNGLTLNITGANNFDLLADLDAAVPQVSSPFMIYPHATSEDGVVLVPSEITGTYPNYTVTFVSPGPPSTIPEAPTDYYIKMYVDTDAVSGHQLTATLPTNGIVTSANSPTLGAVVTSDTVCLVACPVVNNFKLKGYGPMNGQTGVPQMSPVDFGFNEALNATVSSNLSDYFSISPSVVGGTWQYISETFGNFTMRRVTFNAPNGLALNVTYTVSMLKTITNTSDQAVGLDLFSGVTALTETETAYRFSFTTNATVINGGAFAPMAMAGYPTENMQQVPTSITAINVNFDRQNMDTTTFGSGNVYLAKIVNGSPVTVSNTTVFPTTGTSGTVAIKNFTLDSDSRYRVFVTRNVKDSSGQPLAGLPVQGSENGPFYFDFYTGTSSSSVVSAFSGCSIDRYFSSGNIVAVPVGIVIATSFSNPLDPQTITTANVTLAAGETPVEGTVRYEATGNKIIFTPSAILTAETAYTFTVSANIKSITGTNIVAMTREFTTGLADVTKPLVVLSEADNYGLRIEFNEFVNKTTAENKSYYTLKTRSDATDWSSVSATSLTSANIRYIEESKEIFIDGLTLTAGHEFQLTLATSITDLSDNALDDTSSANIKTGYVMDASLFSGGQGMMGTSSYGFEDFDMKQMGMTPISVMPINTLAFSTTNYVVNLPISSQIPVNGTIQLTFPEGFDISGAKKDPYNPNNNDFNRTNVGNTVTFATTDPSGTTTNGIDNDGIGVIGTKTIVIKLSAATQSTDFLSFDLSNIINTTVPKGFETSGYQVEIKTKNSSGVLLEALTSMPFFIAKGGAGSISGQIHGVGSGHNGTIELMLGSPITGPIQKNITITGTGDASADGTYRFDYLPDGEYYLFTNSVMTLGAGTYFGSTAPTIVRVSGGASETKNITLEADSSGAGKYTVTVRLIGDFRTGGTNDSVDIFAGSPNNFKVKTVTPGNTEGTNYEMYLSDGNWMIGVGPSTPKGVNSTSATMTDWMSPQPTSITVSGNGTAIQETSVTANDGTIVVNLGSQTTKTISGTVVDGNSDGISNAEVYAYQPQGGFGGSNAKTATDGTFTLKIPVLGTYSVGAFKPGLPNAGVQAIDVQDNVSGVVIKMQKSDYTIQGKVLNSDGNGVAYSPVWAYEPSGYGNTSTTTDSSGNYILYVGNGTWRIQADAQGIGFLQYTSDVTVNGVSQTGINLRPDTATTFYAVSGNITLDGTAQANTPVRAVKYDANGIYQGREYGAMTDSSGNYSITVPAGIYRIDTWNPTYGEVGRTDADDYANNPANVNLTSANKTGVNIVVASENLKTVTLKFNNATASQSGYVRIEGVDYTSAVNQKSNGLVKNIRIPILTTNQTVKLQAGDYLFFADVPGVGQYIPTDDCETYPSGCLDETKHLISVSANRDVNFVLPDTSSASNMVTVSGTVTSGESNVENAWVWVSNPQNGFNVGTSTASNGTYSLTVPVLGSGNYKIGADKPGYVSVEPSSLNLTDANADGTADNAKNFTITAYSKTISGYLFADADGGTTNAKDTGEEIATGWVYARETTTNRMSHSQADSSGYYSLGVTAGTWKVFGSADGYTEAQYSVAGTATTLTVAGVNLTDKNIKLTADNNWSRKNKNKPITPSSGGVLDDTATDGTGVKITVPANALGSDTNAGVLGVTNTSAVTQTNSNTPFGGTGKEITATDNAGQPITNLNDYIDLEMTYWKADVDAEVTANNLQDYNKLKTMKVSYFDASLNDWVSLPTTRTAYYKTLNADTEWKTYNGTATETGFDKFIDDALINSTFTSYEDYKLVFTSSTNHLTIFGVTTPTDLTPPSKPTGLTQSSGTGTTVVLDWSNNAEADLLEYEVYRSTSSPVTTSSTQVNISQVSSSAFTDNTTTAWTSYYYTATAVDDSGNESTVADEVQMCSTKTVSNGTVSASCAITCDSGYTQSGNSCVASSRHAAYTGDTPVETPAPASSPVVNNTPATQATAETTNQPTEQTNPIVETTPVPTPVSTPIITSAIPVQPSVRDLSIEQTAQTLAQQSFTITPTTEVVNFIAYGSPIIELKYNSNERKVILQDFQSIYNKLPTTEKDWTNVAKISEGERPTRVLSAEVKALKEFNKIFGRQVNFQKANEEKFIHQLAYRMRMESRNLYKEGLALSKYIRLYRKVPKDNFSWAIVRSWAYSGMLK